MQEDSTDLRQQILRYIDGNLPNEEFDRVRSVLTPYSRRRKGRV